MHESKYEKYKRKYLNLRNRQLNRENSERILPGAQIMTLKKGTKLYRAENFTKFTKMGKYDPVKYASMDHWFCEDEMCIITKCAFELDFNGPNSYLADLFEEIRKKINVIRVYC